MSTVKDSWGLITTHCLGNELGTQERSIYQAYYDWGRGASNYFPLGL